MSLILGRSGTQCVAMVTKLLSSYSVSFLVESYCKESNISDTSWLRYLFSSYLIKIWLSVWHHLLANFNILKTWISARKRDSKQHFSSHVFLRFSLLSIATSAMSEIFFLPREHKIWYWFYLQLTLKGLTFITLGAWRVLVDLKDFMFLSHLR